MADKRRTIPPLSLKTFERFWAKVDKNPGLGPAGDCWEWRGGTVRGYGNLGWSVNGKTVTFLAHRVAYFIVTGQQPGAVLCHHCDNPLCVRTDHLFSGSHADNMRDCDRKGRGGGAKRRGKNNGRHTMPERTCRGDAWHAAHAPSREQARQSLQRHYKLNPGKLAGTRNPRSKLTENDVREIRQLYAAGGITFKALGERYGVSKTVAMHVVKRKSWSHVD